MSAAAARAAAGALCAKAFAGISRVAALAQALRIAQAEQDLIASNVLPDRAHVIARAQLGLKAAA